MANLIHLYLILFLGQSLLSQEFNLLYTENSYWNLQYSNCCLKDGRCLIIRQDSSSYYHDSINLNKHFVLSPILAILDKKGNTTQRKPVVYKLKDSFVYYFEFVELNGKLYGRGLQTKKYKNDSFYQVWLRYQEFDKNTINPISNKSIIAYMGVTKIGVSTTLRNNDLLVYTHYKKFHLGVDYKVIYYNNYDSVSLSIKDTSAYFLAQYNVNNNTISAFVIKKNFNNPQLIYEMPIVYNTVFLTNKMIGYNNGSFDTFYKSEDPNNLYNVEYNFSLQKTKSFLFKQNSSQNIVYSILSGFNNPVIDDNDTVHHFQYSTIFEKQNDKFEKYFGFVHLKTIDTQLIFNKFIDDKVLTSSIPRSSPTYKALDNIIRGSDNSLYVVLNLSSIFPKPSSIKVYKLNSKFDLLWKKEYSNTQPIYNIWLENIESPLRVFENEIGGLTLTFDAVDNSANVGVYCLKIDSNGNAIKLEGKDLTKNSITESSSDTNYFFYPNPSRDYIALHSAISDSKESLSLEIVDLVGKRIGLIGRDDKGRYDLSHLNTGIYLARLVDKDGQLIHQERLKIERK